MELVLPVEAMKDMYSKISAPKIMARKQDCEHGQMLYSADGYVTAWFMWQLQADDIAANAFIGEHAELMSNELYTAQQSDLTNE